jgi:CBS domain-containing protein/anti-sigma regulatory factor (Ser/Thr protein kinase)
VNPRLPITEERAPLLVQDLIFTLHVRDVMSAPVIVAARSDSLRHIQELMREYGISGVPIAEDGRLYGIVSLDDIIRALDGGYIGDSAALRMTEQVVVLDEDMPLSFAIRFFEKYRYGRFPVLDHSRRLSGIVTTRNINQSLVVELSRELGRMEARDLGDRSAEDKAYLLREYAVKKFDFENAGQASHGLKSFLKQHGSDAGFVRRAAVASYELEMNLVVHSDGGTLTLFAKPGLAEIVARDNGPGIADVEQALVEGFSTAGDWVRSLGFGAGMGLPNARRVADQFDIQSEPGRGTTVRAVIQQNHATETGDDS